MQLYKHQEAALERYKNAKAIPLLFDPGTGKTLTTLMIAQHKFLTGQIDSLLVIAPNGVHKQWATQEIPKWLKNIKYHVVWQKNKACPSTPGVLNIYCTNVETFSTTRRWEPIVEWALSHETFVVLDEAQTIKNPKSLRSQRILYAFNDTRKRGARIISSTPRTAARAILTGTPVTNGPVDAWALFEFLQPGFFAMNYYAFQSRYTMMQTQAIAGRNIRMPITANTWTAIKKMDAYAAMSVFGVSMETYHLIQGQTSFKGPYIHLDELKEKMYTLAMGAKLEDCVDMPEKVYQHKLVPMSRTQQRLYKELATNLVTEYGTGLVEARTKMTAYIRLQQIASGFVSVTEPVDENDDPQPNQVTWIEGANQKIEALVADASQVQGQFIVICHFTCEATQLFDALTAAGFKMGLQTGFKKIGTIEDFQGGKLDGIVANIRVLSKGFNLQNAHHMFFYSNTFSLEDRVQVEARIHRAGQTFPCVYTDYLTDETIDLKVYEALRQKRSLYEFIKDTTVEEFINE